VRTLTALLKEGYDYEINKEKERTQKWVRIEQPYEMMNFHNNV
jgi:hypothetical protein